jgi:hypothetical protein
MARMPARFSLGQSGRPSGFTLEAMASSVSSGATPVQSLTQWTALGQGRIALWMLGYPDAVLAAIGHARRSANLATPRH